MLTRILLALVLVGFPALARAGDYDIPGFPGEPAPVVASATGYSVDTPICNLAADSHAAAVINRNIPGLLNNSRYPVFKNMSLRTVAEMSSGQISKATLSEINLELGAVKPPPRVAKK